VHSGALKRSERPKRSGNASRPAGQTVQKPPSSLETYRM